MVRGLDYPAPIDSVLRDMEEQHIVEVSNGLMGDASIIPLWFGEGDWQTPLVVREAAIRGLREGDCFYTEKRGRMSLRQSLRDYHFRIYGLDIDVERISVLASGICTIQLIFQMILSGERPCGNVVIVSPLWPNAASVCELRGAEVRYCDLRLGSGGQFSLDRELLLSLIDAETRAIFVNTPCNPTGWVMGVDEMEWLLSEVRERRIWLIADEVYNRISYDGVASPTFLSFARSDDPLLVVNSFSKAWSMTGWRMGWLVHPASVGLDVSKLVEVNFSCVAGFVQSAGIVALEQGEDFIADFVSSCGLARDKVLVALEGMRGVDCVSIPSAGFYVYFRVDYDLARRDILAFARLLAEEGGVGLAPGSSFGLGQEGWLRLCFAQSLPVLDEALTRIESYFNQL